MASRLGGIVRRFASSAPTGPSAVAGEHGGGAKRWKIITFVVAFPSVVVAYINAFVLEDHHDDHPPFIPYTHLRIRTKPFPWGDGNHSLFHNKHSNPLPEGYEE